MNPNLVEVPDDELAAACARQGDSAHARRLAEAAFRTLHDRHAKRLLAFLGGRVSLAVLDDLHQDVWAKVWQAMPAGFRGGNFRAWLHQIARNAVTDHLRKRRHEPLADEGELVDDRHWDKTRAVEADRHDALARCLQKLERANARAADLVRCRVGGESYDTYCARTGMTAAEAYRSFHRAKAQLQACVERISP
jgi:RNA polymerase sigma-70 factor (ECF subfamily)